MTEMLNSEVGSWVAGHKEPRSLWSLPAFRLPGLPVMSHLGVREESGPNRLQRGNKKLYSGETTETIDKNLIII